MIEEPPKSPDYQIGRLEASLEGIRKDVAYERSKNDKLRTEIGQLPEKIRNNLSEDLASVNKRISKNSDRIAALEKWRWVFAGGLAVLIFASKFLPQIIKGFLH